MATLIEEKQLANIAKRDFIAGAGNPPNPVAGILRVFAHNVANYLGLFTISDLNFATKIQNSLSDVAIFFMSTASSTTAPTVIGGVLTTAATISSQQTVASANLFQAKRRTRFQTSTTAGNHSGVRTAYAQWYRSNLALRGGFLFKAMFGANINLQGGQKFIGLCASTSALAGDPSALVNMVGVGYDAADLNTGNWSLMHNDGAGVATKIDLGILAARSTTSGWILIIHVLPNSALINVLILRATERDVVYSGQLSTDIPAVNTLMAMKCEVRNGAIAAADNIEVESIYIETLV